MRTAPNPPPGPRGSHGTLRRAISMTRPALLALLALGALHLGGCAILQHPERIHVSLAGVEPLEGEGFEMRMLVKLRVQNPNDAALDFDGVSVELEVQGRRFATGVSDAAGSVPRFGEAVLSVPVSVPVFNIARQAVDFMTSEHRGKLEYGMTGRLAGPAFGSVRFSSKGELTLPAELFGRAR